MSLSSLVCLLYFLVTTKAAKNVPDVTISVVSTLVYPLFTHYKGTVQDPENSAAYDYIEVPNENSIGTVVTIGGIHGGFYGPNSLYNDFAEKLPEYNISLLRVNVSRPYMTGASQLLLGLNVLKEHNNMKPLMLVGWSMGSASIVNAVQEMIEKNDTLEIVSLLTFAGQAGGCQSIKTMDVKLNIIHGDNDTNVDVKSAYKLQMWAKNLGEFVIIKGAGHSFYGYKEELYDNAYRIIFNDFNINTL